MAARSRIASIDVMRGLVMVIMLMDHVREAIYRHLQVGDPMNVATTAPDLFFTRLSAAARRTRILLALGAAFLLLAGFESRDKRTSSRAWVRYF
jgi:uncharacterized membrane protein